MKDEGADQDTETINVDLKTYVIKPIHALWLTATGEMAQKTYYS